MMMLRTSPLLGGFLVFALLGCNPTARDFYDRNKPLGAGLAAVAAAVKEAPTPALYAPCEKAGLTLNSHVFYENGKRTFLTGNTEIVGYEALAMKERTAEWELETERRDPLGFEMARLEHGPAVQLGRWLGPEGEFFEGGRSPDRRVQSETVADLKRASGVTHLVVVRGNGRASHEVSAYLVEFPAGEIVCGFSLEALEEGDALGSDLHYRQGPLLFVRGLPPPMLKNPAIRNLEQLLHDELDARFGLRVPDTKLEPQREPESNPEVEAAIGQLAKLVPRLDAQAPSCTEEPPDGALMTTAANLRKIVGAPDLPRFDPNRRLHLIERRNNPFLDLARPDSPLTYRTSAAQRIRKAPSFLVIHITEHVPARLADDTDGQSFVPGSASAKLVRFAPTGEVVCADHFRAENPENLSVAVSEGRLVEASLRKESESNLRQSLERAIPRNRL